MTAELGRGGMGVVYAARHAELGVERAVKLVSRADAQAHARFEREARHLARVRHDNVVSIHEAGVHEGQPYLVMDLVRGRPLDAVLRDGRPPLQDALRWAVGVCRGVDALHALGVVHRDLKPANVLLQAGGRPVVVDLGLALAPDLDDRLTRTGGMVGTLGYMAPEQVQSLPATPRTDVYALGLIAFELVTGRCALGDDSSAAEAMGIITTRDGLRAGEVAPELPARLDQALHRATRRSPDARFARAGALADALEQALRDPGPSCRQVARRRRAALLAGTAALAGALALGALALRPARREAAPPPAGAGGIVPELTRLAGDPAAVVSRADAWLAAHAGDPDRPRVERARRDARRRLGDDALNRLKARPEYDRGTPEHLAEALAWTAAYPDHPQLAAVRGTVVALSRRVPLATLPPALWARFVPGAGPLRALLAAPGRGLTLWDVDARAALRRWSAGALDVALTPDGREAFVLEGPRVLRVRLDGGEPVEVLRAEVNVLELAVAPDGRTLAAGDEAGVVHVLELASGALRALPALDSRVNALAWSARGHRLFATNSGWFERGRSPRLFVAEAGGTTWTQQQVLVGSGVVLVPSPDDRRLLVGTASGRLQLFDLETLERAPPTFRGEGRPPDAASLGDPVSAHGWIGGAVFTPVGARLISVSHHHGTPDAPAPHGDLSVWDVATGLELRDRSLVRRPVPMRDVALSFAGDRLLVACGDLPTELWLLLED